MGGWVLEAGAMVLCNKGMLAVDEFEKMEETDQVAMHEALEQGSVSIAKASIVATLPAQTSVLAGGNPKFSRFDNYRSIADQINIPDTLLSRFDLKFVLRDVPNAEKDKLLVDHVLKAREGDESGIEPAIENTLIKKHIAYSKKNCKPKLTKETGRILKDFYIKTRKQAEGGNAPIPITLRQFESMIRIAEASAKVQLSPVVRKEDAQRAIRLMEFSLGQLGYDVATGRIDIDKSEGATSFTERKGLRLLIDLINAMSATKKEIPLKELREASRKEGIHEQEIDSLIDKLKREGMLFEPNPGYVQKV
jgi:replicative DNA helicase Mcm